jgi:formin-binding protein 1
MIEKCAGERDRMAGELIAQIADPLRHLSTRYEEIRKNHVEYAGKLEKERDAAFTELKRTKGKYDGSCQETESRRKKQDSGAKGQQSYQQQLAEMNNVKNTYLISINVTNKQKEKYHHEYLPDLLDSLQDLSETRVYHVNNLWAHAIRIENEALTRVDGHLQFVSEEILRNEPHLDSLMFINHNQTHWQEPPDAAFEASPVWHDEPNMATDEPAKIFLRNILGKSKSQRTELKRDMDAKKREVDAARQIRRNIREGKDKRDEVEMVRSIFTLQEKLHESERKWLTAEVEVSTIVSVVGDISIGAQNHNFKSQTFKIPTNCDLCGERIWGLSAKGFDCKDCGYTCHSKCELKVPANCPGEQSKEDKKKLKIERQANASTAPAASQNGGLPEGVSELSDVARSNTMNSLSSGYAASAKRSVSGAGPNSPTAEPDGESAPAAAAPKPAAPRRNRVVAPPPTGFTSEAPGDMPPVPGNKPSTTSAPRGRMLYPYQASGEGEITVDEGTSITIVEADGESEPSHASILANPTDGSGWMTVRAGTTTGIVPATYVEVQPSLAAPERPSSTYSNSSASAAGSVKAGGGGGPPPVKKKGPAVAPKRGAKKLHHVQAMYDYQAQTDAEFSMSEGDRFVLVKMDQGDGWAEVERAGQVRIVPASYIEDV